MTLKYTTSIPDLSLNAPREGDIGYDLLSAVDLRIFPGEQREVQTPFCIAIPPGYGGLIQDRSSMARKQIYTHGRVIDPSYRGPLIVILENRGREILYIDPGDKIAQLVIVATFTEATEQVSTLSTTQRGTKGFGSTGK